MASLYDWGGNMFLDLTSTYPHFKCTILDIIRGNNGPVSRADIETLVERIQISLLLGQADPDFPEYHQNLPFEGDYRDKLQLWEKRFTNFLNFAKGTHFEYM